MKFLNYNKYFFCCIPIKIGALLIAEVEAVCNLYFAITSANTTQDAFNYSTISITYKISRVILSTFYVAMFFAALLYVLGLKMVRKLIYQFS